jgi:acyl transferase domain-containing protein
MDPIAVIGMSGRFPGASNVDEFWDNLRNGVESIASITANDLADAGIPSSVLERPDYVNARGVLDGIDQFDASFFGFSPRGASALNPQHRIFLECAWTALENAGYDQDRHQGLIGVFAGCAVNGYVNRTTANEELSALDRMERDLGNSSDVLSLRTAHKLNLKGPAITVQTTCSTSLVSVVLACRSLNSHDCDVALAGGVRIQIPHRMGYFYARDGIGSPDGHCRAFDAAAAGTVSGSGCGVVVLKRLSEALHDGDTVHAVIRGAAVNNDGSDKIGFTAPSITGQADVIARALDDAGIGPDRVSYVECHGTGTPLGDPVEVAALSKVYGVTGRPTGSCAIGSVKTNIGHLDVAAGIAGLIKVILLLKHGQVPPSLHFRSPNPECRFESSPFFVNGELRPWVRHDEPQMAAVSSFGMGGTNAHVVVEEAPQQQVITSDRGCELLLLSAKSAEALDTMTDGLAAHLRPMPTADFANAAYTLQVGRKAFKYRRVVVASSAAAAAIALETRDATRTLSKRIPAVPRRIVFMFPNESAGLVGVGRDLYQHEPTFRAALDRCAELFAPELSSNFVDMLYGRDRDDASPRSLEPAIDRAALFGVEYALAQLWISWGIRPAALMAGGVGEFVAGAIAGVLPLADSVSLVVLASRTRRGQRNGQNPTMRHSSLRDPSIHELETAARGFSFGRPRVPIVSAFAGRELTSEEVTSSEYWVQQVKEPVRFTEALDAVSSTHDVILLEMGPGMTLPAIACQKLLDSDCVILPSLADSSRLHSDEEALSLAAGQLWLAGQTIDWHAVRSHERRRRIELPTYPFERQSYWLPQPTMRHEAGTGSEAAPQTSTPEGSCGGRFGQQELSSSSPIRRPSIQSPTAETLVSLRSASVVTQRSNPTIPRDVNFAAMPLSAMVTPSELEDIVRSAWRTVLGVEQIGSQADFFELGGDSLLILQTATHVRRALGVDIPTGVFYEETTIAALCSRIQSLLPPAPPESDRIAALLHRIESLTDDQASALLGSLDAATTADAGPGKAGSPRLEEGHSRSTP